MTTQRLADALRAVLAVSDRKTDVYAEANAALAEFDEQRLAPLTFDLPSTSHFVNLYEPVATEGWAKALASRTLHAARQRRLPIADGRCVEVTFHPTGGLVLSRLVESFTAPRKPNQ